MGILGAMLHGDTDVVKDVIATIPPDAFHIPAHRTVYEQILELAQEGKAIDLPSVTLALDASGRLTDAGGPSTVAGLAIAVSHIGHLSTHRDMLMSAYAARQARIALDRGGREIDSVRGIDPAADIEVLESVHTTIGDALLTARGAAGSVNGLPRIESAADVDFSKIDLPGEVIEGFIHRGCKAMLGSGSKIGKSWAMIQVALAVATGTEWLGMKTARGRVLYLNFELPRGFFWQRVGWVADALGIPKEQYEKTLDHWPLRGKAAPWSVLREKMELFLAAERFNLVIVDPIYKGLGGAQENDARDIALMLNEIEALAVRSGSAVMFSHHYSKGNQSSKEAIDRVSGSGVWARDPDAIITLTSHEQENCYSADFILRNCRPRDSFVVEWQFPLFVHRTDLDPNQLKKASGKGKRYDLSKIADCVDRISGSTYSEWFSAAKTRVGIGSKSTFRQYMIDAIDGGLIEHKNNKYVHAS